ncbi:MAG: alpha/beta hydrolase [Sandaracinaceae bacterium]|nr:alpha/beta hydrolase [Sandaracinaceae bacterium]
MLHYDTVVAPGASPEAWILFCHGILGRGSNWRGFARGLAKATPRLGALLVDLRAHGGSRALPPPDTLEAAAADLVPLVTERRIAAVIGHSFGGKVALALSRAHPPPHLFLVDSLPSAQPERVGRDEGPDRVIGMLESLPARFADRVAFHTHVEGLGYSRALAGWLGQNLEPTDGGLAFGLDLSRIRALLADYFARDLWDALDPPAGETVAHVIIAGRSDVYGEADRARAAALAARHARVRVHVLEHADHWVHVDDPGGLAALVEEALA